MWLCTQLGFFSIVRKEADTYHIRARCREDLDQLTQTTGFDLNTWMLAWEAGGIARQIPGRNHSPFLALGVVPRLNASQP